MRIVFDTNTLISAILKPDSLAMHAVTLALQNGTILFSEETMAEINDVIQRQKFDAYIALPDRQKALNDILKNCSNFNTQTTDSIPCRDQTDVKFLRLAVETKADAIVSGDADLKILNPFRQIPILSIREFISFVSLH